MKLSVRSLRQHLQPLWLVPILLGAALIGLVWTAIIFHLDAERRNAAATATQNAVNLALVFEQHVLRAINEVDKTLLLLREAYANSGGSMDLPAWAADPRHVSDLIIQLAIVGADGRLISASASDPPSQIDLRNREHFRTHADSTADALFISRPVLGRGSGKWTLQLTRRITTAEGGFGGVVVASLNPERLARLYDAIDIGANGSVTVVGLDGIVRARSGGLPEPLDQSLAHTRLFREQANAASGSFWSTERDALYDDGRLVAFRKVEGHPLIVAVSLAEQDIFAALEEQRQLAYAAAAAATLLVLAFVALGLRHRIRLERALGALAASEARARETTRDLEVTLDNMSQGIMMVDGARNVSVINRQAAKLLDLPDHFLEGRWKFDDLVAHQWATGEFGPDGARLDPKVRDYITAGGMPGDVPGDVGTYERMRPNGTVLEIRSVALPDGGMVRTFTDITERRRNEERMVHMARHDTLTGLANRAVLRDDLMKAAARLRRHGERFAVVCLDLDKFKPVNDTLGHAAGDVLLQAVARRLRACTRETDTVARLGGDEFAILQSVVTRQEDLASLATRLLDALKAPFDIDGNAVSIGCSIGIALAPANGTEPDELMRNADLALYRAKASGRSCFRLFEPAMDAEVRARRTLEYDLARAIDRDELTLDYQPIISLGTHDIIAVEALVRWRHPKHGHMSSAELMRAAEDARVIVRFGEWLLNRACSDAVGWSGNAKLAVNLAPAQFKDRNLVDLVTEALAESGLPARRLEIEVTETVLLDDRVGNLATLHQLRNLGITMTLDDFGTGYSSLSYLRAFPFDKIKIDGSFVHELPLRPDCIAIVAAVSDLGRRLGMATIAEGVESEQQLEVLRRFACTGAQGSLFGPPQTADEIARLLLAQSVEPKNLATA